ncbi:hypothetical protein [Ralstonia pseudosolanacearum]|uniref:hypothetical protein n=1 Tax=Ralstonia pseudosolanacearum TaxID=1310165 RepID=UPI003391878D
MVDAPTDKWQAMPYQGRLPPGGRHLLCRTRWAAKTISVSALQKGGKPREHRPALGLKLKLDYTSSRTFGVHASNESRETRVLGQDLPRRTVLVAHNLLPHVQTARQAVQEAATSAETGVSQIPYLDVWRQLGRLRKNTGGGLPRLCVRKKVVHCVAPH